MGKNYTKHIIIATALIIISIVGSVLGSQYMKQNSIERQKQMDINQENKLKEEAKAEEATKNLRHNICIAEAEDAYWSYVELNGTGKRDDEKGVWAENWVWDRADERKQTAIDNCFKQFKK